MSRTAVYLYCLAKPSTAWTAARAPKGLPGAGRPRAIALGNGLLAIVADAPLARYGEAALGHGLKDLDWVSRCAIAHESVVEHAARAGAVLPTKLFTLFHDDARVASWASKERKKIERTLARVRGCDEFGVRVFFDETKALREAESRARRVARPSSGAGFLARKRELRDAAREAHVDAHDRIESLHASLDRLARDTRRRAPLAGASGPRLVLDAAYLVRASDVPKLKKTLDAGKRALGAAFEIALTGPWPPYNFVGEAA